VCKSVFSATAEQAAATKQACIGVSGALKQLLHWGLNIHSVCVDTGVCVRVQQHEPT
jgi:hypothetical protein